MKAIAPLIVAYLCLGSLWWCEKQDVQRLTKDVAFWKESYEDAMSKGNEALDLVRRNQEIIKDLLETGQELKRQRDEYKNLAEK